MYKRICSSLLSLALAFGVSTKKSYAGVISSVGNAIIISSALLSNGLSLIYSEERRQYMRSGNAVDFPLPSYQVFLLANLIASPFYISGAILSHIGSTKENNNSVKEDKRISRRNRC